MLHVIVDAATDGIVSAHAQCVIVQANRATEQMFGYTGGDLLRQHYAQHPHAAP